MNDKKCDVKGKEKRDGKRKFGDMGGKTEFVKLKESKPEPKPLRESIRNQTHVSLSMVKRLFLKDSKDKNIVFSPLLLHVLLSIVAVGSDGSTLDELLSFLRSNSTDHLNSFVSQLVSVVLSDASAAGGPDLRFANSVWVEQSLTLHHSFKQLVTTDYKATLTSVDFQNKAAKVANEVNSWAKTKTNGLINNLLPPGSVDNLTRLILANALYFKGAWKDRFETYMTKNGVFHLLNGTSVKVPFMVSKKKQFISVFIGFKVLGLPYEQGECQRQFSMYIFLPDAKDGLPALVDQLTSKSGFLEHKLPRTKVEVGEFRIPKFKISFGFETSQLLKKLGVVLPFSPHDADLTKMVDSPNGQDLCVSEIFHKSFIEVNEEGTEAVATTSALLEKCFIQRPPRKINFVADHPFLFVILEDLFGTLLFIGQVLNPLAG